MPSSEDIVKGLARIAGDWPYLAILWHVYFGTLVGALLAGIRAPRQLFGFLLAIPLLSVSALAWSGGNPFNGASFALAAMALIVVGARFGRGKVELASFSFVVTGGLLFAFGWGYPHFLAPDSMLSYLYAAPTGLIPCPTLSAILGVTLVLGGFGSVAWPAIVGLLSLFYGFYGAAILDIYIDWILFAGGVSLLIVCVNNYRLDESGNASSGRDIK